MKNKFKLFTATTALVGIATPIITLASCNKGTVAPIVIDEKEKTKELEKGSRSVDYNVTLSSAMGEDEMLYAELSDQTSTQSGYKAEVYSAEFMPGEATAKVKVKITTDTDEILKDGTTFKFSINIQRLDAERKEVASTKIEGFTIKYTAPTKEGLSIAETAKSAWSNPGDVKHTFIFDVDPTKITVDNTCTFECDVTNKSTSTEGFTAQFVKATPVTSLNQLYVEFDMNKIGTKEGEEHADFDFTLSCSKDGNELWRQTFTGFQIKYLYYQMYIDAETQKKYWPATYAGEDMFHIYILKNPAIKWGDPTIQPAISFNLTNKLKVGGTVTEGKAQGYEYFDVPVKITPAAANKDEDISFVATVSGNLEGQPVSKEFPLTIKYVANKLTATDAQKSRMFLAKKSLKYEMALSDSEGSPTKSIDVSECKQTSSPEEIKVFCSTVTMTGTTVNPIVRVNPVTSFCSAQFNLVLDGKDADGNIIWQQRMNGFTANYIEPIILDNTTISTEVGENRAYLGYTLRDGVTDLAASISDITKTDDIESLEDPLVLSQSFRLLMVPKAGKHFNNDTFAQFTLKITGKYTRGGVTESWDQEEAIRMSYNGFLELDERTPAQGVTAPGFTNYSYIFNKYCNPSYTLKAEVVNLTGTPGYNVKTNFIVQSETATLETNIVNESGEPIVDGAYCKFNIKFTAYDGAEEVWSKIYTDPQSPSTKIEFSITYSAGLIASSTQIKTTAGSNLANMQLTNIGVPVSAGDYYQFSLTDKSMGGIDVELQQDKIEPTSDKFNLGLKLTKASPFEEGDFAVFSLIATRYNSVGVQTSQDKIANCRLTYQSGSITWNEDDWYVTALNGSKKVSADKNVTFNLDAELQSKQTLYATITEGEGTDDVALKSTYTTRTAVTPVGKTVSIPMHLETTKNFFTIADYRNYSIKFECENEDGSTAWSKTIDDTTLAMFANFSPRTTSAHVASVGELTFDLTAWIPDQYIISDKIIIKPKISEVTPSRAGLGTHVMSKTFGVSNPEMNVMMPIDEEEEGLAQPGDTVKFKIAFDVIAKLPTRTITVPITISDVLTLIKD